MALSAPYTIESPISFTGKLNIKKAIKMVAISVIKALLSPGIFKTPRRTINRITGMVAKITNCQNISESGKNDTDKKNPFINKFIVSSVLVCPSILLLKYAINIQKDMQIIKK